MMSDKFAHTRAFLSLLARDHSLSANYIDTSTYSDETHGSSEGEATPKVSLELVRKVVRLLEEEDEDSLKALLIQTYAIAPSDPMIEQYVLDLMHKHKDDLQGVPFVFLTPTKRPISRPSSRASFRSAIARPETPSSSVPTSSPLVKSLSLRRPHTPLASPLSGNLLPSGLPVNITSITANVNASPNGSPVFSHTAALPLLATSSHSHLVSSQPPSPLSSPHFLNAKAVEFRPVSRPHSAMSGSFSAAVGARTDTPSPDLWAHHPLGQVPPGSPRKLSGSLAIASPLVSDVGYYPRPNSSLTRSNSGLRKSIPAEAVAADESHQAFMASGPSRPFVDPDDDDHDEFSPFAKGPTVLSRSSSLAAPSSHASASEWSTSQPQTYLSAEDEEAIKSYPYPIPLQFEDPEDMLSIASTASHSLPPSNAGFQGYDYSGGAYQASDMMTSADGMTPFDVLHSVFGSTIAPATLEEALSKNGYDFESAMAWLVETNTNQGPIMNPPPRAMTGVTISGGRVSRDTALPLSRNSSVTQQWLGAQPNRAAVATGGRVCRYFLAGECRRADCRFNHDVERALCRFWLKAQCAKGDQCEFVHALPQEVDISVLTNSMNQTDLNDPDDYTNGSQNAPQVDDFPMLGATNRRGGGSGGRSGPSYDPGRTRFAAAVKKSPVISPQTRMGVAPAVQRRLSPSGLDTRGGMATPKPSPRLKLRPPSLLPTLATGEKINQLYMRYRSRAIQLGGERNAYLTKAAEAWKRGDGAGAKQLSKEAHELNVKMNSEANDAASHLVAERAKSALEAVRIRDASWSDDPMDRSTRGKIGGDGLGVLLGVASANIGGVSASGARLTPEERTEVLLDLHGLHSNEAVDVLERFLLGLERENFLGLAYIVVGEEKHTGTQDSGRGSSKARLAAGVKDWLHKWSYPWNERGGICCVDPLTHS